MNKETRCIKIKLKPNSLEKVQEWKRVINERKDEALATLRDEGVILETVFLDQTSEGDFLIYFMKAESFDKAKEVFEKSVHAIDAFHQKFKNETWEGGKKLELLIDLSTSTEID
jgi:arabinogalactan endo-1,4-beta-galactosidase